MPRVMELGHVGIFVRDLDRMVAFYRDVLGMQITKQNFDVGAVLLSADPIRSDHEIALVRGRGDDNPKLIHQISMRVETLDELRAFHRLLKSDGYTIDEVVLHVSAIGIYFFDPEGNRTEVFWLTGRPCWVPAALPIDLDQPNDIILAEVDRAWDGLRDVRIGGEINADTGRAALSRMPD